MSENLGGWVADEGCVHRSLRGAPIQASLCLSGGLQVGRADTSRLSLYFEVAKELGLVRIWK